MLFFFPDFCENRFSYIDNILTLKTILKSQWRQLIYIFLFFKHFKNFKNSKICMCSSNSQFKLLSLFFNLQCTCRLRSANLKPVMKIMSAWRKLTQSSNNLSSLLLIYYIFALLLDKFHNYVWSYKHVTGWQVYWFNYLIKSGCILQHLSHLSKFVCWN